MTADYVTSLLKSSPFGHARSAELSLPARLAVILDLTDAVADGGVALEQTQPAAKKAGGVRSGDMVFGCTGKTRYFATEPL
jgi:hypothetical protein